VGSKLIRKVTLNRLKTPLQSPVEPCQHRLNGNLALDDCSREIGRRLGITDTASCIAVELYRLNEVRYSRNRDHYLRRYHSELSRLKTVTAAFDGMASRGWIDHDKKPAGTRNNGRQSSARILPKLAEFVYEIANHQNISKIPAPTPKELIVLRDKAGELKDYNDSQHTSRRRDRLKKHGELILSADIHGATVAPMTRVYNDKWTRGGRAYAAWQRLPKADRRLIQIDSEPVVELDYRCIHPSILYAERALQIPADCYDVDGVERGHVKLALLIIINAASELQAIHALAHKIGGDSYLKQARQIIDAVVIRHKPIAGAFFNASWAHLQCVDSTIAESVWWQMTRAGVPCLPVHDSFIVAESATDTLRNAMAEASEKSLGVVLEVTD